MVPIIFDHGETSFTSNGLFRLADCASCKVAEALNGIYECQFRYPVSGRHYKDIDEGQVIFATHDEGKIPQPFDIYKRTAPQGGIVTFYARHISYRLSNVVVEPYSAGSTAMALEGLRTHALNPNPFTFIAETSTVRDFELEYPASVRNVIGGLKDINLIALYGGEVEWDRFTVRFKTRRGQDTDITLRYGKNISDMSYTVDDSETFTAVVPYWYGNEEIAMLPEKIISTGLVENFEKAVPLDLSSKFDEFPVEEDLREEAERALAEADLPKKGLTVKFYQLWESPEYERFANLQRTYLGDTVKAVSSDLGVSVSLRVTKYVYDTLLERYESMELGQAEASLATTIQGNLENIVAQVAPTMGGVHAAIQAAIDHASDLIKAGSDGHVVFNLDANGNPKEILVMDTDNILTAVNVMRINVNGIGFSSTGYDGTYTNAWTLEGVLNTAWVNTWRLNAGIIVAGTLMGADGKNWLDLEADEAQLNLDSLTLVTGDGELQEEVSFGDAALQSMVQSALFDKLTNNGQIRGIWMQNGQMYINMDYLKTGRLVVKRGNVETFSADAATGAVSIVADSFSLSNGNTINSIAHDEVAGALAVYAPIDYITQTEVFNKLTNNGQMQGIWMQNGQLFISFDIAQGGQLTLGRANDSGGVLSVLDPDDGEIVRISNYGIQLHNSTADTEGVNITRSSADTVKFDGQWIRGDHGINLGFPHVLIDMVYHWDGNIDGTKVGFLVNASGGGGGILLVANQNEDIILRGYRTEIDGKGRVNQNLYVESTVEGSSFVQHSDRRLKENIKPLDDYRAILKLKPVSFDWKDGSGHVGAGFVAQDVQEVLPDLVRESDSGMLAVSYVGIVPYLVKALQEAEAREAKMKKEIDAFRKRLDWMDRKIEDLKLLIALK